MFRSYRLDPLTGVCEPLVFEWYPVTGIVRGLSVDHVRQLAKDAKAAEYTLGHPHPTPYKTSDPLRRPGELAVVLGSFWTTARCTEP